MDTVFAIARRVSVALVVFVLGLLVVMPSARGQQTMTKSQALAACQAAIPAGYDFLSCQDRPAQSFYTQCNANSGDCAGTWPYVVQASSTPCATAPRAQRWVAAKILNQYFTDQAFTDPATGATGVCKMVFNPATPPMQAKDGTWYTYVLLAPVSDTFDPAPLPSGQVNDSSGNPVSPAVPNVPADASGDTNQTAPQMCGGGSCYDPNTGNYCAVSGGGQVCVHGSAPTIPPNSCSGAGLAAICAGSPTPPVPNAQIGISDPATQINSTDHYTTADPSSGAVSTTTVNVYGANGASTSSGAQSGSISVGSGSKSSPASSSSSGGNNDSYGGGGDCNTPPVCQGDAVLCGVTLQQWRTMCSAHTDMQGIIGDGKGPPTFQQDQTKYSQSDVWQSGSSSSDGSVGGQANSGNYDSSGFGYSTTCPLQDLAVPFGSGSFVVPFSEGCVIGPWLRAVIIGFAFFSAAVITAGGRG